MQDNFLAENNLCGQTILRLVAHGNAIVAELLRLSRHIPHVFLPIQDPTFAPYIQYYFPFANKNDTLRYKNIIFDFTYLKNQDAFEQRIQSSAELLDLDDEFRENHITILERFYLLFDNIYKYYKDFVKFIQDLENGVIFIQQTFESVLVNPNGKQLLCEGIYLYGVILLLLDMKIPGPVRERMLISYFRYKGGEIQNIDTVCKLCRSTGYIPESKKLPPNYPTEYFARLPLPSQYLSMIVGRLRSDDIYNQSTYYPLPEHRSVALATQASMLYIILYFLPNILNKENAIMREIVDKHFPDNWVISFYLGFTVDISTVWGQFKAAAQAIKNTLIPQNIKEILTKHVSNVHELNKQVQELLTEGVLSEEYVLDNINKLLSVLRSCNVTLRWLMLHRTTDMKQFREMIMKEINMEDILLLVLNTSQLEFVLKNMFIQLLAKKEQKWNECRSTANERMNDLSKYFSGEMALVKTKDEQLQSWFTNIANSVMEIDYNDSTMAGRKIQQLITALEDVEEFHQIEQSLQVKQYLSDTRDLLKKMIRYVNIKESVLVSISTISDISYAWEIISDYVDSMQVRIKKDPSLIIKIRSTFLKLASMLELPLVRISQAQSQDIVSVSSYYSAELVAFVRKTLDIIPMSMFSLLDYIIDIQTNRIKQPPTRFPRDQLKDYAQLDDRFNLARATYGISKYTEGVLAMETTLMGVIEIDPKKLLEDGIRKELVRQVSTLLDSHLVFSTGKIEDFEEKLKVLKTKLEGMLLSFEYIQDYVNLYGLKIWQEEFARIINYNVEQECNNFLKRKVYDWQSAYQSKVIPIPQFKSTDDSNNNFMGRLVRELLQITDTKKTTYYESFSSWYDLQGKEVLGINTFSLLRQSIGIYGMKGVDTLLGFQNVKVLQAFVKYYKTELMNPQAKAFIDQVKGTMSPPSLLPQNLAKQYPIILPKLTKYWQYLQEVVVKVGRVQLLRRHIASELNFSCKLDANALASVLDVMNKAVLNDIEMKSKSGQVLELPQENKLLSELAKYLEMTGMADPMEKVYITSTPLENIGFILFLYIIFNAPRFVYDQNTDSLVCRKKDDTLDGIPFITGILTILKQVHPEETDTFFAFLGQYVRANLDSTAFDKANFKGNYIPELPSDVVVVLRFLQSYCKWGKISFAKLEKYIPPYLFTPFFNKKK